MNIESTEKGDELVLTLDANRLDALNAPALKAELLNLLSSQHSTIILDLGHIEFMDSSGLGVLVSALKRLDESKRLIVCRPRPAVARLFAVTRMTQIFEIQAELPTRMQDRPS